MGYLLGTPDPPTSETPMPKPDTVSVQPFTGPDDIEARSMAIIESEVPEPRPFQGGQWLVARRLVHTTADFEMLDLLRFSEGAVEAGKAALAKGCVIHTDTQMARAGIPMRRMRPLGCDVRCLMDDPGVAKAAKATGGTRAAAAVDALAEQWAGAILVVGNAPTALLRIMEHLDRQARGAPAPALVVGMPVGFVNAAESKELLMARADVPWMAIAGRKGGSALAGATINALADMVLAEKGLSGSI